MKARRAGTIAAALAVASIGVFSHSLAAQTGLPAAAAPVKTRVLTNHFPEQPSLPPVASIPLAPLGFTAPSTNYLGARNSFVSLDFIDENHLLFTFRVPGLIHRDLKTGEESTEREIRAVVLSLPQGTVQAEALWTVHDRIRYLWPLKDGHFLLRDRNNLLVGDTTLVLKPFLDFPGSLLWVELDPAQKFLVTNSHEPLAATAQPGQVGSPTTASASVTTDQDDTADAEGRPELVVRILQRETGQVLLVSRVRSTVHLPINTTGYLENLRGRGSDWLLNLTYFTGGTRMLGNVETACDPDDEFLSENEILVTGCNQDGARKLVAMTTAGKTLWIAQAPGTQVWPLISVAPNGSRLAWTTLDTNRQIGPFAAMDTDDIKEQSVTVFDAATGDIAFVSPLSPILDAGGNVAISPSGRRVALLNAGAIQIFDLPAPPPLPGR